MPRSLWLALLLGLVLRGSFSFAEEKPAAVPDLTVMDLPSSMDGKPQKVRYWLPKSAGPHPVFISLHSWSGDYTQDHSDWLREAVDRGWIFIEPNFRGPNEHPEACGSALARRDVLDSIDWALKQPGADPERVYVAGVSGGGHMTMMMAAFHPERISAASAWVGISDLAAWHAFHTKPDVRGNYALMAERSCGGAPGSSADVDLQFYGRSPIHFLQHSKDLPLEICAGITDGKTGSVPIKHSLNAFNVIAQARQTPQITNTDIHQLWEKGKLDSPQEGDTTDDPSYGRAIYLRRHSGPSRVTIFEGGHEGLPHAACVWLSQQGRPTQINAR